MPDSAVQEKALLDKPRLTREQIAQRAAFELPDGAYVNLGWGIPNLIADYLPKEITVYFHSENGILGMGRRAKPGEEDYELVDAIVTDLAVIDVQPQGLVLREVAPGWIPAEVQKLTGAALLTKGRVPEIHLR